MATAARRGQSGLQLRVVGIDPKSDHMYRMAAPCGGYFYAVNQRELHVIGGSARRREAARVIMVGQRQNGEAARGRACNQCLGRQRSVGMR